MIVLVVNIFRIAQRKAKRDAPIRLHGNGPGTPAIAFEFMQAQRRDAQIVQ